MSLLFLLIIVVLTFGIITRKGFVIPQNQHNSKLIAQVTSLDRGEDSERETIQTLILLGINPKAIFHDLYIQKTNGSYTQVDLVVATKSGILVFEIKDYSGWIFGNSKQKYWTQTLNYGHEKHRFYNPILQNEGHIEAIRQSLSHNPNIPIYSVIVFYGDCELKRYSVDTPNTFLIYPEELDSVIAYILAQPPAIYGNKNEIMNVFTQAIKNGDNPNIRSVQISEAQYYGRNKPKSTYRRYYLPRYYNPIYYIRRWFR